MSKKDIPLQQSSLGPTHWPSEIQAGGGVGEESGEVGIGVGGGVGERYGFGTQAPNEQTSPDSHSLTEEHVLIHLPPTP